MGRAGELRELGDALTRLADALLAPGRAAPGRHGGLRVRLLKAAVHRHGGNLSQAATELGIHRNTLRSKLQRNGRRTR